MTKAERIAKIKTDIEARYSYLQAQDIENIYESALAIYLSLFYPFDKSVIEIPESELRDLWWVKQCMVEIIEREGVSSAVSYKENGLDIRFDSTCISAFLRSAIIPKAGTI